MISIGVDAHKSVHVAVALDATGQVLGHWRGANSAAGWAEVATWAQQWPDERQWGIEGAWNYGRGLAQHLVAAGETVYEVNTRWTARGRRRARSAGKTDARDAQAIALAVWREGATLPHVTADDATAVLDVLVTQREAALAEATRLRNQAHQLLLQSDPAYRTHVLALTTAAGIAALERYQPAGPGAMQEARAAALRMLGQRLRLVTAQAGELKRAIEARAQAGFSPLIQLKGVQALSAGMLAACLGPGRRFRTDAGVALYAGVAPLEASSAGRVRHRLNRGGNRRLTAVIHRIALAQLRSLPAAQAYVARRLSEGKTKREALRALKRYLVRTTCTISQAGWNAASRSRETDCRCYAGGHCCGSRSTWMRFASRITFSGEGLMMRTQSAVEREVKVSFEPDRLAQESLARAYARLVADPVRAQRARPWPQRRLLAHTGRDQRVQEVER